MVEAEVVVTEHGRPASAALAQAIVDAKRGDALAPVTVVVPSNFAGLTARRVLGSGALGVEGVANVRFVTPFRFAELLSVGQLADRRPLTNPVLEAAVRRALADDPKHLRAVRDHQATERALAELVGELANTSAAARRSIHEQGGAAAGLIELNDVIRGHLGAFHDEADVAGAAAARTDLATAIAPFGHVIWHLPGPLSTPLAGFLRTVLSVVPCTVIVGTTGDSGADAEVARSLHRVGVPGGPLDGSDEADPVLGDHVISVTDADEEVRAVIREIVQLAEQNVPLDRIGVFHPVPDPYVRILEQQFAAAGIPANGPSRRRLAESVAGRVLTQALALPSERWRRDRVVALANSGPLRFGDRPARPAVWDAISRSAGVVGGVGDWRFKLDLERRRAEHGRDQALADGLERRAGRAADRVADIDELAVFIESLIEHVRAVETASGWSDRADAARALLSGLFGPPNQRTWWPEPELDALDHVEAVLDRLAMLDAIDPTPTMAVFARALASELSVAPGRSGRFGDGVVYGPLASAPGHDLDAVFVLGCAEGLLPAPRREDSLLADSVRALANGDLPLRLGQLGEQHRWFLAALAAAPAGRRWLFFPRGDLRSSRRARPSRWLLPTASKLAGRTLYATDFEHQSPPGVHEVASHAEALLQASRYASVHERDVAEVFAYVRAGGEASAHPVAHLVDRGLRMQAARRSRSFTEFDGHVSGVAVRAGAEVMSASRLETWATCGFRYFLGHELGLAERDDPERTIELSALDRGSAMHEVLERFMTEQIQNGAPAPDEPWTDIQRARAQQIAHDVFEDYERRGRTGRRIEWQTQKSDLLALIDDFLTHDDRYRAAHRLTPEHVELEFGMGAADPLELALDHERVLRFRGMIDRVDRGPRNARRIVDYKTGRGKKYKGLDSEVDPTRGGTMLQLGLYAEAVSARLGGGDLSSEYWMVDTAAGFARHGYDWTSAHRARLVQVLTLIADGIEAGVFPAEPGEWQSFRSTFENCAYCDFDRVCPRARSEHAADKAGAGALAVRRALSAEPGAAADDAEAVTVEIGSIRR